MPLNDVKVDITFILRANIFGALIFKMIVTDWRRSASLSPVCSGNRTQGMHRHAVGKTAKIEGDENRSAKDEMEQDQLVR